MATMQKITPNLWFDKQAGEAVDFYISVFKHSRIIRSTHYGKEGYEIHQMPEGSILTIEFELEGQNFLALNGGPVFKFNEAVSFIVNCVSQEEIDYYWEKLSEGGDKNAQQCGWLKDKFGVSWQVVPTILSDLFQEQPGKKTEAMMAALLKMKKLEMQVLLDAYNGAGKL